MKTNWKSKIIEMNTMENYFNKIIESCCGMLISYYGCNLIENKNKFLICIKQWLINK